MNWIANSYSHEGQESFVINQLNSKKQGYYVEIGGYHATQKSNTYLLETKYDWVGVSLEIDKRSAESYNKVRKNYCIAADATTYDLKQYFIKNNWPKQIDYLQLDIEPAKQTLAALLNIPMDYRYSIITFEHDIYYDVENHRHQNTAYEFLMDHGYKRVVKNIMQNEDWYIDPFAINCDFLGENLKPGDLFTY